MKTFINKRVSEEKFRYFFESYSEQYGYDHATKEIIHIFIFVARFYNQGELGDFGCSLLKQQISAKMLFKCWRTSIALLAVCDTTDSELVALRKTIIEVRHSK